MEGDKTRRGKRGFEKADLGHYGLPDQRGHLRLKGGGNELRGKSLPAKEPQNFAITPWENNGLKRADWKKHALYGGKLRPAGEVRKDL